MKCAVTGGSGFIGSHLVDTLVRDGRDVLVIDTRPPLQDVEWKNVDIRDDLDEVFQGVDTVFHLAALANARICGEYPVVCNSVNILGTANVLKASRHAKVRRFVLASSAWIAGAQLGDEVSEYSPIDLRSVNTVYGASKIAQEALCISFQRELGGPDFTILRYGAPYGSRMWKGLVVRAFMQSAEDKGIMTVFGDGKQTRQFLYVDDLCQAHLLLDDDVSTNKIYYLTGDVSIAIAELAREVQKYFLAAIDYVPQQRVEPNIARILNNRAKEELGWLPQTGLEEGIRRCIEWWQQLTPIQKSSPYWWSAFSRDGNSRPNTIDVQ